MILFSTAGLKTFGVRRIVHRMEVKIKVFNLSNWKDDELPDNQHRVSSRGLP